MPSTILFPILFVVQIAWFLAPGLAAAVWLYRKKRISAVYVIPLAGVLSCVVAYGAFWLFLLSHPLGETYSWAIGFVGLGLLCLLYGDKRARQVFMLFEVFMPLLLWCLVAFFYSSTVFACRVTPAVTRSDQLCHVHGTTFDNLLPKLFADNVNDGHPKTLMGDWRGSDRPPLQTGAVLLEAPLTESPATGVMSYQLLAVFLQAIWVPAVWVLARRLGLSNRRLATVFVFCIFSGFFFFNSVFVWPKLLAGGLAVIGLCLVLFEKKSLFRWCLAAIALSGSLLAHGGVIFAFPPLIILLLTKRYFPGWKIALASVATALLLFMPWLAYQHFYDPPGNRLLKWSIAGDTKVDDLSFGTALHDAYSRAGVKGTASDKLSNTTTLFYASDSQNHVYLQGAIGVIRDMEFRFVFFGLGLLNLGWLSLFIPGWRRRLREADIDVAKLKVVLGIAAVSLAFWVVVMLGPGTTILQSASFLTMLLLFTGLAAIVTTFPRLLLRSLVVLQVLYFMVIWVGTVYLHHFVSRLYVLYGLLALTGLVYCLYMMRGKLAGNG